MCDPTRALNTKWYRKPDAIAANAMIEQTLIAWIHRNRPSLMLSLRTTVAGLLTFVLGHLLGLSQVYWAVLTAVIVMQQSVGGSLKASVDRLIGTLGGAVWGVVVAMSMPHTGIVSVGIALAVALAPLTLLAALRSEFRVAPATVIIVILGSYTARAGPMLAAADRVFEIALGAVVAMAVALFVVPSRAHAILVAAGQNTLDVMSELIMMLAERLTRAVDPAAVQQLHDQIRNAMTRIEAVTDEARRERAHRVTDAPDPEPLVRTLRRLRNDLVMVSRATVEPLTEPLSQPVLALLGPPVARLALEIGAFMRTAGATLVGLGPAPSVDRVAQALAEYDAAMSELRRRGLTHDLSDDAVGRIFSLAFAFEQLGRDLADLADRVRD